MWNRAHLKAYRLAALLAVADNYVNPIIQKDHIDWAMELIRKDIGVMRRRISSGDVGIGDAPRERKLLSIMQNYITRPLAASYGVPERMRTAGIVPRKYLQIATQRVTSFSQHRLGQSASLDLSIKSLIDNGYITEYSKEKCISEYEFHGKSYRIIHLPLNSKEQQEIKKARNSN
jgi:hypothetical protein